MFQDYNPHEKENLNKYSKLIKEFVDNGIIILSKKINSKANVRKDYASLFLFRQIVEVGDAISELIKIGCINACKPLLRTLFECYFQLHFLFKEDEDRKSLQLLYHNEIRKRDYYEKLAYPNKGGSFHQRLKNDRHLNEIDLSNEQKEIYIENIKKINTIINDFDYKDIKEEYDRIEKDKEKANGKKYKVKYWYELFEGPKNAEGIMIILKETALYEFIYRDCSAYTHGEDLVHPNLEPSDESTFGISSLRDIRQLIVIANNAILLIERCCLLFLQYKVDNPKKYTEKFFPLVAKAQEYRNEM
jgi:hypothetical protein